MSMSRILLQAELSGVYFEYFEWNWLCYKGPTYHVLAGEYMIIACVRQIIATYLYMISVISLCVSLKFWTIHSWVYL